MNYYFNTILVSLLLLTTNATYAGDCSGTNQYQCEKDIKQTIELKSSETQAKEVEIFGLVLGRSSIEDVRKVANFFEEEKYGRISKKIINSDRFNVNSKKIQFAKFKTDGKNFRGVFFDGVIIQVEVLDDLYSRIDRNLVSELRAAFNKKYDRIKSNTESVTGEYSIETIFYERWQEPSGAFSVELAESKSALTNSRKCYSTAAVLKRAGMDTATLEASCNTSAKITPIYDLTYQFDAGRLNAIAFLSGVEKNKKEENDKTKKKYLSGF